MSESENTFRDRLLRMESRDPSRKEQYERKVKTMIEKQLTGRTKYAHIASLAMSLFFLIFFGAAAILAPREFPAWGRLLFITGALFGLAMALFEIHLLRRGTVNLRTDNVAAAGLGWGVVVVGTTIVLVFSSELPDPIVSVRMIVYMIVFEIAAGLGLLKAYLHRSELNLQEKLLEIEYRLAQLADKLDKAERNDSPPPAPPGDH